MALDHLFVRNKVELLEGGLLENAGLRKWDLFCALDVPAILKLTFVPFGISILLSFARTEREVAPNGSLEHVGTLNDH